MKRAKEQMVEVVTLILGRALADSEREAVEIMVESAYVQGQVEGAQNILSIVNGKD